MATKTVWFSPEVRDLLERSTIEGPASSPVLRLPRGQLERPLYEAVNKVLVALGGKWDRRTGGHQFTRPLDGPLAEALHAAPERMQ